MDSVDSDSPAMAAGIQNGDIVHALNGAEVKSVQGYAAQFPEAERRKQSSDFSVPP